jgi:hypothetical protein
MESTNNNEISLDEWEVKLQTKLKELQDCQKSLQLSSCLACSKLLECQLRDIYVHAVYSSMNKGAGGGFEF